MYPHNSRVRACRCGRVDFSRVFMSLAQLWSRRSRKSKKKRPPEHDVRVFELFTHIPVVSLAQLSCDYIGFEGRQMWTRAPSSIRPPNITNDRVWLDETYVTFAGEEKPIDKNTRKLARHCPSRRTLDSIIKHKDGVSTVLTLLSSTDDLVFGPILGNSTFIVNNSKCNTSACWDIASQKPSPLQHWHGRCVKAEELSSTLWFLLLVDSPPPSNPYKIRIMSSERNTVLCEVKHLDAEVGFLDVHACGPDSLVVKDEMSHYYFVNFVTDKWVSLGLCNRHECLTMFSALSLFVEQLEVNTCNQSLVVRCAKSGAVVRNLDDSKHVYYVATSRIDDTPDNDVAVALTLGGVVQVWNITTGRCSAKITRHKKLDGNAIKLVGGHSRLVTRCEAETVLWA